MIRQTCASWLAAGLLAWGCSHGPNQPVFCQSATEAVFDLQGRWLLPFPSDYYLTEDSSTPSGFRVNFTDQNTPRGEGAFKTYEFLPNQVPQEPEETTREALTV